MTMTDKQRSREEWEAQVKANKSRCIAQFNEGLKQKPLPKRWRDYCTPILVCVYLSNGKAKRVVGIRFGSWFMGAIGGRPVFGHIAQKIERMLQAESEVQ